MVHSKANAEMAVLGALMLDNRTFDRVAEVVAESDFDGVENRLIYRHIKELLESNRGADMLSVVESLAAIDLLSEVGGAGYISRLAMNTPSANRVMHYVEIMTA